MQGLYIDFIVLYFHNVKLIDSSTGYNPWSSSIRSFLAW